jgi:hypothetical protein
VAHTASTAEIKRAYYGKARAYHPDSHAGSTAGILEEAARAMASLNQAWNVLRDPRLRAEYERTLTAAQEQADAALASAVARRRRARAGARAKAPAAALIGHGFRHHLSACTAPGADGARLDLSLEAGADLRQLRHFDADSIWGLHADGAALTDRDMPHVGELRGLQVLDLAGSAVTDVGLLHLQGLGRLEMLSLWETDITDAGMAIVGRLEGLRLLGLGRTRVGDAGLARLGGLGQLRVLQLWGTAVVGPGLAHLHSLSSLEIVTLPRRVGLRYRRALRSALPAALVG